MNGKTLTRDHGFPLRAVVPGFIGARSVKWIKEINVIDKESQNQFQQKDYKLFLPSVNWDTVSEVSLVLVRCAIFVFNIRLKFLIF